MLYKVDGFGSFLTRDSEYINIILEIKFLSINLILEFNLITKNAFTYFKSACF